MPKRGAVERAKKDKKHGKSPSTQAGEFVREEIRSYKEGDGPQSRGQAVAIGLSKARRAGVDLGPPNKGDEDTRKKAKRDLEVGRKKGPI